MDPLIYILPDEKQLFARMARGDEAAFEEIFHHYNRRIYPFILKRTKSATIAEEITQEVFLKLWANRESLPPIENHTSYIFTMTTNKTYNYLRKLAGEGRMLRQVWQNMNEFNNITEETIDFRGTEEIINQAVEQLPPQRKKIYLLSRQQGFTHEQIAQELDISRSTVNNQLLEALRFIREFIQTHSDTSFTITVLLLKIL